MQEISGEVQKIVHRIEEKGDAVMRLDYQLEMRQTQKLLMTPQLQQAIKLLQLPALELNLFLQQSILENPMLEMNEEAEGEVESLEQHEDAEFDLEWEQYLHQGDGGYSRGITGKTSFEHYTAGTLSLPQLLRQQLRMISLPAAVVEIAANIIDNLSADGYLRMPTAEIARQLQVKEEDVLGGLSVVQTLEPVGIGARNLQECLLLQVDSRQDAPPFVREIICQHLDLVAKGRIPVLAEILQADYTLVQNAIDYIRGLEPKPGVSLSADSSSAYILPDVSVLVVAGKWVILVNDSNSHRLHLSPSYQAMLRNADSQGTEKYLRDKLNSALWLLKAIEQRRTTLYRITEFILEYQEPFFSQGVKSLRPMRLLDVAQALDVHESTVSRATNGKYLQTPRGVYAFKYFFSANLDTVNGVGVASTGVKQVLEEVVASEDKGNPLTDQQIAQGLGKRGIKISRRTVAKYRDQLAIPSSNLRKRWQ